MGCTQLVVALLGDADTSCPPRRRNPGELTLDHDRRTVRKPSRGPLHRHGTNIAAAPHRVRRDPPRRREPVSLARWHAPAPPPVSGTRSRRWARWTDTSSCSLAATAAGSGMRRATSIWTRRPGSGSRTWATDETRSPTPSRPSCGRSPPITSSVTSPTSRRSSWQRASPISHRSPIPRSSSAPAAARRSTPPPRSCAATGR